MQKYLDREEAGYILAQSLTEYANLDNVIVLGLPRGGVPVAYQIAKALNVPLDVFIVRKLGVPDHAELAMGAIALGNVVVYNEDIIASMHIHHAEIEKVIAQEKTELKRREQAYRGQHTYPILHDKIVILVDDGIATGATIRAAIKALQQLQVQKIIVAVPVAQKDVCAELANTVNKIVCPLQPSHLHAVGVWYEDFSQTEDSEVSDLLKKAKGFAHG